MRFPGLTATVRPRMALPKVSIFVGFLVLVLVSATPIGAIQDQAVPEDLQGYVKLYRFPSRTADFERSLAIESGEDAAAFRLRAGEAWRFRSDDVSAGVSAIWGGALPVLPGPANSLQSSSFAAGIPNETRQAVLATVARELVDSYPGLFPFPSEELVQREARDYVRAAKGHLETLVLRQRHDGLPVRGTRLLLFVNRGNLIYVEALDLAPVSVTSTPTLDSEAALDKIQAHLGGSMRGLEPTDSPELYYVPVRVQDALSHRLVWDFRLERSGEVHNWQTLVDAHTGEIVSFEDFNRYVCSLELETLPGRAVGGIRPEQATDEEKIWGFENLLVLSSSSQITGASGGFAWTPVSSSTSFMDGRYFQVFCSNCEDPQTSSMNGVVDFGTGGLDGQSNGASTAAARSTFFHANAIHTMASKWVDLTWLEANVPVNVDIEDACNAFWDGVSINFFRSGNGCNNTGENRDVISHEYGHGLDQNDGLPPRDSARGEAVSDILAAFLDRDSCIGESFLQAGGDSDACSGVRDILEDAPGGKPLLTVDNVKDIFPDCPPGQCCRGPLDEECHWEGYVLGQAHWHLAQSLLNGVDVDNPGLGSEAAWHVLERMHFGSTALAVTYLPWTNALSPADPPNGIPGGINDIPGGTSMYLGYLLSDDEGDGIANGTPHAAYVNEAFDHHGMLDDMDPGTPEVEPVPDAANCTQPADPAFQLAELRDAATGVPQVQITWTDVAGAASYTVYRARAATDGMVPVASDIAPGVQTAVDPAVDPGEEFSYWVAAVAADDCISPGATRVAFTPVFPQFGADPPVVVDGALGDGDGAADIGETFGLSIALANFGTADATNVTGRLVAFDTRLRILDEGPHAYPDLAMGAPAQAPSGTFTVELAPDPSLCGTEIGFALEVEADDGCSALRIPLSVEADCTPGDSTYLQLSNVDVQDGNNARLDPGEGGVSLPMTFDNAGTQDATGLAGTLASQTAGVTVGNAALRLDDIAGLASGTTRNQQPSVDVDPAIACGTVASFRVDLLSDQGPYEANFQLPIGDIGVLLADDFESDSGWSVMAPDPFAPGNWMRGPVESTIYQARSGNPFGTPATAWATGPSSASGPAPAGSTSLVSPWIDLSGLDAAALTYNRWVGVAGAHDDTLRVEMSSDEFRNDIVLIDEVGNDPVWREATVPVPPAMLQPGVQIRFVAEDDEGNSVMEAAVDDLTLTGFECTGIAPLGSVRLADFRLDDPVPFGNADGFADPGEVVTLILDVNNVGGAAADSIQVSVSSPTPGVDASVNPDTAVAPDPLGVGLVATSLPDHVSLGLDPTLACGSTIDLVFDLAWNGGSYSSPPAQMRVGQEVGSLEDNFDSDLGWTTEAVVDDPVRGAWQRAEPIQNFLSPSGDSPFDSGTFAYVTGNGSGGNFRDWSVWNNTVTLISPVVDLSDFNSARVSFFEDHRFFAFGGGSIPLRVEASNDGFVDVVVPLAQIMGTGSWSFVELPIPGELLTDGFQVRFQIVNRPNGGLVDSAVDDVKILGDWCPGAPLAVEFLQNGPVCNGDPVRLVSIVEGLPATIEWDLDGDGQFGITAEEMMEDPVLVYPDFGVYDVSLRATDAGGGSETVQHPVEVWDRPVPTIDQEPGTDEEGRPLDFMGSATGGDTNYTFTWDFGDGQQANGAAVQHQYDQPGDYIVTFTVVDGNGCPDTVTTTVTIQPNRPPDPIQGLLLRDGAAGALTFQWNADIRAETYHVYAGDLLGVSAMDPGCITPNPPLTDTTVDLASPPAGSFYYLVSGANFQGEGTLDSTDVARGAAQTPCN